MIQNLPNTFTHLLWIHKPQIKKKKNEIIATRTSKCLLIINGKIWVTCIQTKEKRTSSHVQKFNENEIGAEVEPVPDGLTSK